MLVVVVCRGGKGMSGFTCRQLINLVFEELFSNLPQHRSLLLSHRLQVALDFAVVFRC